MRRDTIRKKSVYSRCSLQATSCHDGQIKWGPLSALCRSSGQSPTSCIGYLFLFASFGALNVRLFSNVRVHNPIAFVRKVLELPGSKNESNPTVRSNAELARKSKKSTKGWDGERADIDTSNAETQRLFSSISLLSG